MCIAICVMPGSSVSDEALSNCFDNNPDGAGFTYICTDVTGFSKLMVKKSMDYDTFLRQYKRAFKNNPESPFLIHFRVATHGTIDRFNCHPFRINKSMAFIHNGIISGVGVDRFKSDTQLFNEKVLKTLPKGWDKCLGITTLLEKFLTGSKLATLDIEGNVNIYNESAGHWKDGVWYSNHSYSYKKGLYSTATYVHTFLAKGKKKDDGWNKGFNGGVSKKIADSLVYYVCDNCLSRFSVDKCEFFLSEGDPFCFCKGCVDLAYFNNDVSFRDKITQRRYSLEINNVGSQYGCSQRFLEG